MSNESVTQDEEDKEKSPEETTCKIFFHFVLRSDRKHAMLEAPRIADSDRGSNTHGPRILAQ